MTEPVAPIVTQVRRRSSCTRCLAAQMAGEPVTRRTAVTLIRYPDNRRDELLCRQHVTDWETEQRRGSGR